MNFPPLCTNLLDLICTRKYNCPICLETLNSNQGLVTTKCNHQFCIDCYTKHSLRGGDISCPMCRQEIMACEDSDKERLGMYNQFEQLASTLEEEGFRPNLSKMEFAWKIGNDEDEITYHTWVFGCKTKDSSRSDTPVIEVSDEERQKICTESIVNLQKNITDTWDKLNRYRPN